MRYWFDTEFIERGHEEPIRLLSIGIVSEDGREFYKELGDADVLIQEDWVNYGDPWLRENVLPHLNGERGDSRGGIRDGILEFCDSAIYGKPEFWAYYADYDWVVLCQIFGRMVDLPKGWPMYCRDLKQFADDHLRTLPKQLTPEHHALNDARWTHAAWLWLVENQ